MKGNRITVFDKYIRHVATGPHPPTGYPTDRRTATDVGHAVPLTRVHSTEALYEHYASCLNVSPRLSVGTGLCVCFSGLRYPRSIACFNCYQRHHSHSFLLRLSNRPYTMIPSVVSWSKMDPGNPLLPGHLEKRTFINHERHRGRLRRLWEALLVLLLLIVTVTFSRRGQIVHHSGAEEVDHSLRNPAYLIKAKHGAVASENVLCSSIGVEILKEGGNAVDAAVATTFCVGVVNMFS